MFNTEYRYKKGYTLAEMLMVLVIFSLMMIALPPLTRKMFKVNTVAKAHGRFECYYNNNNHVIQYEISEKGSSTYTDRTSAGYDYCEFIPPSNSVYTMIHAVGGGGAGYVLNSSNADENMSVGEKEALSYLYYSVASLWPEWFKYVINNKGNLTFDGDKFEVFKTYRYVSLPYGAAGKAGEKISMFFPRLKGVTIRMYPGVGGAKATSYGAGGNGTSTVVKFKYADNNSYSTVMEAHGGTGGNLVGKYGEAITGGYATDYGVSKLAAVKSAESGFDNVIEDPGIENNFESRINITDGTIKGHAADWKGINAGWGGNGSYYFVSSSAGSDYYGRFSYQINNYNELIKSSDVVERYNDWKLVTKYVKKNFYSRNGQKSNCDALQNGTLKVKAWCSADKESPDYLYKCKIDSLGKILDPTHTNQVEYEIKVKNNGAVESNPSGYTNCTLKPFKNYVICTTSSAVTDAYRNCTFTQDAGSFACPYGDKSGNMCKASDGGNGAVIILW